MKEEFYIWSFEHDAWWKPNSFGYTRSITEAGKYPLSEALNICKNANVISSNRPSINEAMVPVSSI